MKKFVTLAVAMGNLILVGAVRGDSLNDKLAHEVTPRDQGELHQNAKHEIETAPGLSDDQRSKLLAVRESYEKETGKIREELLRLKAVLMKDVITTDYNQAEVDLIEGRINRLERKRVTALFRAVKDANRVLGHQVEKNPSILKIYIDQEAVNSD